MEAQLQIAALVLAAGQSKRYGQNKLLQLLPNGKSLMENAVEQAQLAGCQPVVVVTGAFRTDICQALDSYQVLFANNENWPEGMGSSIACGAKFLLAQAGSPPAFFILLADQPLVTAGLLRQMVSCFQQQKPVALVCDYGTALGPPVLFDGEALPALSSLRGNEGAKSVLNALGNKVLKFPFPDGAIDIDRPDDWQHL